MVERTRLGVLIGLGLAAVAAFFLAPSSGTWARVPVMVLCGVLAVVAHLLLSGPARNRRERGASVTEPLTLNGSAGPVTATDGDQHQPGFFELDTAAPVVAATTTTTAGRGTPPAATEAVDLSQLPDPPADWPPTEVEVPLVFQMPPAPISDAPNPAAQMAEQEVEPEVEPAIEPSAPFAAPTPAAAPSLAPLTLVDTDGDDRTEQVIDLTYAASLAPGAVRPTNGFAPLHEPVVVPPPPERTPEPTPDADPAPQILEPQTREPAMAGSRPDDPWLAFAASMFRDD